MSSTTPNGQQSGNWNIHQIVTSMKSIFYFFCVIHTINSLCLKSLEIANISSTRATLILNRETDDQCENIKIKWKLRRMKACPVSNFREKYSFYHLQEFHKYIFIENLQPFSVYQFRCWSIEICVNFTGFTPVSVFVMMRTA